MLKPAILYKKEILTKIQEYNYIEDMMYYSGYLGNAIPSIEEDTNGKLYQYAIVDDGKLIGYFTYQIDWYFGNAIPSIEEDTNGKLYQYAIVDDGKLIGYFTYQIDWYSSCVYRCGLFSFDRNNIKIGIDVYRELKKIINEYHIHRIEWRMISGNPVEKHCDKFCQKYRSKKYVLTDVFKDRCGKYHNESIYEIIF